MDCQLKKKCHLYECLVTETAFDKLVLSDATVVVGIQGVEDLSDEERSHLEKSTPIHSKV